MKKFNFLIFVFLIITSCTNKSNDAQLNEKLNKLKDSHEKLIAEFDSINNYYVKPFRIYENIVLKEKESNPDSIIKRYKKLIKNYPNSFWKHESERRIENIKKRKKYWTEKNGWKFDDIPKKPNYDEQIISCPGC